MAVAFVFPGQGSQTVGMGKPLADTFASARAVFEEVDAALGERLSETIWNGPADALVLTENAQPALMAVSLAVMRVLEAEAGIDLARDAAFVAGHSLGEYSALAAAGAFGVADAARLLRKRGVAMQQAVPVGIGGMAAILGADVDVAAEIAREAEPNPDGPAEICQPANDNAPGQVVLSGHAGAIERAIKIAAGKGFRRAIRLPVSAPFHCHLMKPAADAMAEALEAQVIAPLAVPVFANVSARPVMSPAEIRRLLVEQVTAMVRWRESVLAMKESGVDRMVELGAGKVLTGLVKRIDAEIAGSSVGTPAEIEAFLRTVT